MVVDCFLLTHKRIFPILTPSDLKVCNNQNIERRRDTIVKFTDYIFSRNFWIYKHTCLKRSLVLFHFLRKLGIIVSVCFGVRYDEEFSDREAKKNWKHIPGLSTRERLIWKKQPSLLKAIR